MLLDQLMSKTSCRILVPDIGLQFADIVGKENVTLESSSLKSTFQHDILINGVVRPRTSSEVQAIVKLCNLANIALYPVSRGKNWGYGSALPVSDGCFILDMSRMNQVLEVNEELAYVIIEPGVTQGALYRYLHERNIPLQLDPSGAGPKTSLLGNIAERGYGIGENADHFGSCCNLEVVLGDGQIINTTFGQFANARAKNIYKYGVGPFIDGLFTQSNFGVITKLTLWLQRKPEVSEILCFSSDDPDFIYKINDRIRECLADNSLPGSCNIVSRNRVLTTKMQYPWNLTNGSVPLPEETARRLGDRAGIQSWNCMAPIFGNKSQVRAIKRQLKKSLKSDSAKFIFFSEKKIQLLSRFKRILSPFLPFELGSLLKSILPLFELLRGNPLEISMPTCYWRNKSVAPESDFDPDRDNCGIYWLTPVIPMRSTDLKEFVSLASGILAKYSFEFCPTFTTLSHRAYDCSLPLLFDKEDERESAAARLCYHELFEQLVKAGFVPYRFGVQSMDYFDTDTSLTKATIKLKHALDPNNVIAPGRYCPVSNN